MNLYQRILKYLSNIKDKNYDTTDYHPVKASALIVEDVVEEAELLEQLLSVQHCLVTKVGTVKDALEALVKCRFHLVFVDLHLPDGNGSVVVRKIKESARMTHAIILSGLPELFDSVLDCGYIGVLPKPYSISSIREVLIKHRLPVSE